ncbi:DnaJ like protein subfamily C member 3 [Strigomonas culicis]|uniref:DnaJ like protein subfamily C member 3 n=1 Tax=Strigomonas culicis TaxID=28005 RepID=S9V139_9TRYP|nr:DnaJ like protein subfamily C member 3 [Strigomonas culicis]|eukprot:EPY34729.1 DnaJ like protein subfamily C member 3 [Strigomonas culicis]
MRRWKLLPLLLLLCLVSVLAVAGDEVIRRLLAEGDKALSRGRSHYPDALAKYTEALVRDGKNQRGLYSRAELLSMLHRTAEALQDLDALLRAAPDHVQALDLRAMLRAQTGDLRRAAQDEQRVVQLYAKERKSQGVARAQKKLALLENFARRWAQLSPILDKPLEVLVQESVQGGKQQELYTHSVSLLALVIEHFAKDNVELRLQRAACALAVQQNQIATTELKFVLKQSPQNLLAIALNARALRGLGALNEAKRELRRCLSLDPEFGLCAQLHKAVRKQQKATGAIEAALESKKYEQAIAAIDAYRREEPRSVLEEKLLEWRCDAYLGLRDSARGVPACRELVALRGTENPLAVQPHLVIAELYMIDEAYDKAESELAAARRLDPRNGKIEELAQRLAKQKSMPPRKDYYKILGVKKSATSADIRRAYRKLARELHPDQLRSKDMSDAERQKHDKKFRDINEAKEVLMDDEKRTRYDNGEDVLHPQGQGTQGTDGDPTPVTPTGKTLPGFPRFPKPFPRFYPRGSGDRNFPRFRVSGTGVPVRGRGPGGGPGPERSERSNVFVFLTFR